jgi:TPR repeat protein
VLQDKAQAARLHRQAAEQGHSNAQHNLGVWYEYGKGVQ